MIEKYGNGREITSSSTNLKLAFLGSIFFFYNIINFRGGDETERLFLALCGAHLWAFSIYGKLSNKIRFTSFSWVLILYATIVYLSCFWSLIPSISFEVAIYLSIPTLIYFLTRRTFAIGFDSCTLKWIVKAIGLLAAISTIVEFAITRSRASGLMLDFNANAAFLNAILVIVLGDILWLHQNASNQLIVKNNQLHVFFLLIIGIAATRSLSGMLALGLALVVFAILCGIRNRGTLKILFAAIACLTLATLMIRATAVESDVDALDKLTTLHNHPSFTDRLAMAASSLSIFRDHAPFGVGVGIYKAVYPRYRSSAERDTTGDLAHNDYFQLLAEGGPALACLPIVMLILLCIRARKIYSGKNQPQQAALVAASVGILVHSAMNFILYIPSISAILGLFMALLDYQEKTCNKPDRTEASLTLTPILLTLSMFLLVATLGARSLFLLPTSDLNCHTRLCGYVKTSPVARLNIANFITATQPTWIPARLFIIDSWINQAERWPSESAKRVAYVAAIRDIIYLINRFPQLSIGYSTLAQLLDKKPSSSSLLPSDFETDPSRLFAHALELDPTDVDVRIHAYEHLVSKGDYAAAYETVVDPKTQSPLRFAVGAADSAVLLTVASIAAANVGQCNRASLFVADALKLESAAAVDRRLLEARYNNLHEIGCGLNTTKSS